MIESRRGVAARLGISALNLPLPGLGLLRSGHGRLAAAFFALDIAALGLLIGCFALTELTARSFTFLVLSLLLVGLGAMVASALLSWRRSAELHPSHRWWSRWYGMLGIWLAWAGITLLAPDPRSYYRGFWVPAHSMSPTLDQGDRFIASMRSGTVHRRGDLILVRADSSGTLYVKRIAGLPGDRIAMEDGIVIINGTPVAQRLVRREPVAFNGLRTIARRLAERFPGEEGEHEIYDVHDTTLDNMDEMVVLPDNIFVLGDNRDFSADSRAPVEMQGFGLVPLASVAGRPLFFTPWRGGEKSGRPIGGGSPTRP